MEPHCYSSIEICRLRVAKLTTAGAPDDGASNGYVTDRLIQGDLGLEIEEGLDVSLSNGCGDVCASIKRGDKIKRANLSLELCVLDAELLSLLVGGTLFTDTGDTIGMQFTDIDDATPAPVCVELWTTAWDSDQQATPAALSNAASWFHWVLPKAQFQVTSLPMRGDEFMRVSVEGFSSGNSNITINGPFNDWPAEIANAGGITKPLGFFLDSALPDAECGFIEVPSGS